MAQLKSTVVQGALTVTGNVVANKLIKLGGTSSQILMADGNVKTISNLITIPNINIDDTGSKPIVGDITSNEHTITVTRIGLDDLGLASAYKYKGSKSKYSDLPTSGNTTGDVWNVTDTGMNYAWTGTAWDALGSTIDTSGFVSATKNASVTVAGITKDTYTYNKTAIFAPNGLIMGGAAAAAGLVTRGICGVSTPNATTGACNKDNLYLNYDSNNDWNPNGRGIVINAGSVGDNLGNGMYQYCAVRGDVVKAWVESKKYLTTEADTLQTVTTRGAVTDKAITTAGLTTTSTLYITGTTGHREGIRITPYGELSSIWWNATGTQDYTKGQMWGITAYTPSYTVDQSKQNTFRFRGPTSSTAESATDQMWINTAGLVTSRGGFAKSGKSDNEVLLAGGGTKALSDFAMDTEIPPVYNGTLTMKTSGTGVSGSATFTANQSTSSTFTVTLDSSAAGNRGANKVVLAKAVGQIDSDKFTVTSSGTTKSTIQYNTTEGCLEFVFA